MSSDGSDSEYEGANHKTHSDSEGELDHKIQRNDEESAKGPQTPKSCSPRSQDSIGNSRDIGYQDDSRGLNSPLSDSQGAVFNTQDQGPRSPSPTSYPQSPPRSPDSPAKSPQSFARSLQSPPKSPESPAKSFQSPSRSLQSPPQSLQSPPRSPQSLQRSSQSPPRSPQSPAQPDQDDDGRSDISSGSSLLSHQDNKDEDVLNLEAGEGSPLVSNIKVSPSGKNFPVSNADDLSDVSDLDDSDGLEDKEPEENHNENAQVEPEKPQPEEVNGEIDDKLAKETKEKEAREKAEKERQEREKKNSLNMDDGEQLDFEADDQPEIEKEDGEIELGEKPKDEEKKDEGEKSGDEGEVMEDEESLEDGEVTDEGDPKPEKPPVCRFYSRGQCTWGINCRFLHPGVTDKGNYTMFDVGRPMVAPPNGPASLYPLDHRAAGYGHPLMVPPARVLPSPYGPIPVRRDEPALVESAWERGLRQAKEMMRKSTKRKETDMDFEEKKMNLSIGQDEIDKENDYYTRAASPIDEPDPWGRLSPKLEPELRRPVRVVERYEDIIPEPLSPGYYPPEKYDYRRGYDKLRDPEYLRTREKKKYYEEEEAAYPAAKKSRREKMVREVIVQRVEKTKERHHAEDGTRRKADEWSDPWMRSKSPSRKVGHRSRKASYSSGSSSFSSRSGSRSSSNSSYTSYSRSRSRSLSNSRSPVSRSRKPRTPPFSSKIRSKKPSPPKDSSKFKPLKAVSPVGGHAEKKITVERSMLMNPPAPTPKRAKERPLSPTAMRKVGLNPPPPTPKTKNSLKHSNSLKSGKIRSRKSRSSSGSGSSGSSSESSRSSYSSSSSTSRGGTPPVRPGKLTKKIEPNESLAAQAVKGKAMDALKVSGQKPQIKLTLKPPETKRDKPALPPIAGKKRPAAAEEAPPPDPKAVAVAKPPAPKKTTSRREELLKQLKAVEDAIARKRSKI